MTTSRTIDNLPASDHARYAEGEIDYDPKFVRESFIGDLAAAPEITSGYVPQLDLIFGLNKVHVPFAHFDLPPVLKSRMKRKRKLFSRRGLLADLDGQNLPEDLSDVEVEEAGTRDRELMEAFLRNIRYIDFMLLEAYGKIDRLQLG